MLRVNVLCYTSGHWVGTGTKYAYLRKRRAADTPESLGSPQLSCRFTFAKLHTNMASSIGDDLCLDSSSEEPPHGPPGELNLDSSSDGGDAAGGPPEGGGGQGDVGSVVGGEVEPPLGAGLLEGDRVDMVGGDEEGDNQVDAEVDADLARVAAFATERKQRRGRGRGRPAARSAWAPALSQSRGDSDGQVVLFQPQLGQPQTGDGAEGRASPPRPADLGADMVERLEKQANVKRGETLALQVSRAHGFNMPAALCHALAAASSLGQASAATLDEEVFAIAKVVLREESPHLTSRVVASQSVGVRADKFAHVSMLLSAGVVSLGLYQAASTEEALCRSLPRDSLVRYLEFASYDETPLPVEVRTDANLQSAGARAPAGRSPSSSEMPLASVHTQALVAPSGAPPAMRVRSASSNQKVVQTMLSRSLILKRGAQLYVVRLAQVCPLAVVQSANAETLRELQLRLSNASPAARVFKRQSRIATTDSHPANILCEQHIARERGDPAQSDNLHQLCDVHKLQTCHEKEMALVAEDVSGMVNLALSLRNGANMERFRACLADEIASRLEVLEGSCPPEAKAHKKRVLGHFIRHGASVATRRLLLVVGPNGDWRARCVQVYVPLGHAAATSRRDVAEQLASSLIVALCNSQPSLYPRSRWTGADIACDELALLESVHKLLSTTYFRFAAGFAKGAARAQLLAAGVWAADYSPARRGALADAFADVVDDGPAGEDAAGVPSDAAPTPEATYAAQNAKVRGKACRWLTSDPLPFLVLQRNALEPIRCYQTALFQRASSSWEEREQCRMADALRNGTATWQSRLYNVAEAADGVDDKELFARVRVLFSAPELWALMPPQSLTVSMRSLAFRCVSRLACAAKQWLSSRHANALRVFSWLKLPEEAEAIKKVPKCVLGQWASNLRDAYPELSGDEFFCILAEVAQCMAMDTAAIESKHATVRRLLVAASLQTRTQSVPTLSSRWLLLQFRRALAKGWRERAGLTRAATKRIPTRKRKRGAGVDAGARLKRKAPRGGAARAFVHLATRGADGKPDFGSIMAKYQEHKRDGTAMYRTAAAMGRAATRTAKRRRADRATPLFGPKQREVRQALLREMGVVLWQRFASMDLESRAISIGAHAATANLSLTETLSLVRRAQALARQRERQQELHRLQRLREWRSSRAQHIHDVMASMSPPSAARLGGASDAWLPIPTPSPIICVAAPPALPEDVEAAIAWASGNGQRSALGALVADDWERTHRTINPADCRPLGADKVEETNCFHAGMCLCSPEGRRLAQVAQGLLGALRRVCSVRTRARELLVTGHMVFRVVGYSERFEIADTLPMPCESDVWWHVGLCYLSPFRPTSMRVVPVPDVGEAPPTEGRVYVDPTEEFATIWDMAAASAGCAFLACQFFEVEESQRGIGAFVPNAVPILKLRYHHAPYAVWPNRTRKRGGGEGEPADAGGDDQGEGVEEDAGEHHAGGDDFLGGDEAEPGLAAETKRVMDELLAKFDEPLAEAPPLPPPPGPPPLPSRVPMVFGGAASSGLARDVCPPAPPPPAPEPAARGVVEPVRGVQGKALAVCHMAGGKVSFYAKGSFEAVCAQEGHGRCRLTRQGHIARGATATTTGRPLGLIAAWLAFGVHCGDRSEHADELAMSFPHEVRLSARRDLLLAPGGADLASFEKEFDAQGPDAEPEESK